MKYLKILLFLSNVQTIVKLFTLIILTFLVLILDYNQFDSLLFNILITLVITDILFLSYIYINIRKEKLEKIQFEKISKNNILFWCGALIIWAIFFIISDKSRNSIHFINLYLCYSYLYINIVHKFIIYNRKGILKNGLFVKFILFDKIQDIKYQNERITIHTENRIYRYTKSENRGKYLKKILEKHSLIQTSGSKETPHNNG